MRGRGAFRTVVARLGAPFAVYAAGSSAYLVGLTAAAMLPRRPPNLEGSAPMPAFDILIPAHNEALTMPRLLSSLAALDYPADRMRVHVVADNCSDATAAVGRAAGACVYERQDRSRLGKGYALAFGLERVLAQPGEPGDGVLIVDADSELSPTFPRVLAAYLAAGAQALQGYYSVRNASDSSAAMLRYVALCLYHYLRPLGRARLGLSAGLRGNGMCFTRAVLADVGWPSYGLTEDVEQHFRLLERGIHVAFAPEAVVRAEMPVTLREALTQNRRWERGRLNALVQELPRFARLALRRRDLSALDALIEQLLAPLSVCLGAALAAAALGLLGRSRRLTLAGLGSLLGQALYVLAGLRLAGAPPAASRALLAAPGYVAWKVGVWLRAAVRSPEHWQRTARLAERSLGGGR